MMDYRIESDRRYTATHEWVKLDGPLAVMGVTDFAQHQLSDLVFVDLPSAGEPVEKGASLLTLESVKAVSDVFAPISGTIAEVNDALSEHPELVNADPYGEGWLVKLSPRDRAEADNLMDADAYARWLEAV